MIHVRSSSPCSVASFLWKPTPNSLALTIATKATYVLEPGTSRLAAAQEPLFAEDIYWDGTPASLRFPTDIIPFKRRVDVYVVGNAYAPRSQPVESLVARIGIGSINKALEIHGNRFWLSEDRLSPASAFVSMPLRWELAAGGLGTSNPVGVPSGGRHIGPYAWAPNLYPIGWGPSHVLLTIPPVGFAPLASDWPERAENLGRHIQGWVHSSWAQRPLPNDIDAAYFNAAPPDQQLDQLTAGTTISLENLHPDYPLLQTIIERTNLHGNLIQGRKNSQPIRLRCDTLCIDTIRGICTLTWRAMVPIHRAADEGIVEITMDGLEPVDGATHRQWGVKAGDATAPLMDVDVDRADASETIFLQSAPVTVATLPFLRAPTKDIAETQMLFADMPLSPALPFEPTTAAPPKAVPEPQRFQMTTPPNPNEPIAEASETLILGVGRFASGLSGGAWSSADAETTMIAAAVDLQGTADLPFQSTYANVQIESFRAQPFAPDVPTASRIGEFADCAARLDGSHNTANNDSRMPASAQRLLELEVYASILVKLWSRPETTHPRIVENAGLTSVDWLVQRMRYRAALEAEASHGRADLAIQMVRAVKAARTSNAHIPKDDYD